ncbi:ABC transporter ATP-binding protein [Bacillaceae bacterium S4-13-58]
MTKPLLTVDRVDVTFRFPYGEYDALKDISFSVYPNEVVGIVGESGCGKSLTSQAIMGILPNLAHIRNGSIRFKEQDLTDLSEKEWERIRGNEISMIFQEPLTSLNPLMTIGKQIGEVLKKHSTLSKREIANKTIAVMTEVGLSNAEQLFKAYPHQLSGGMRQRVVIAMALIGETDLIIADEPTTALDVTIQLQILDLFQKLKQQHHTSFIFISHDWGVVRKICDRVIVMYAGRVVEEGSVDDIIKHPKHPYTKGLIQAIPDHRKRGTELYSIPGKVPALQERGGGCPFADRCTEWMDICSEKIPTQVKSDKQMVACHLFAEKEVVTV